MKTRSVLLTLVLVVAILLGTAGSAFAATNNNTLTVTVQPGLRAYNAAFTLYVCVYGPNGYYRSGRHNATGANGPYSFSFTGAPYGDYRVRVQWLEPLNGSVVLERNKYGYPFASWPWWNQSASWYLNAP
jgi:uncharacterized protein (DUF2141 family)